MQPVSRRPLRDFWDAAYRLGDHVEHWDPTEVPAELVAAVEAGLVRPGQTALDIGCGAGCEAVFLALRGVSVIAVDTSPAALELVRRRADEAGVEVDTRRGSALELPLRDREADFALDRGCLHVIARRRRKLYARQLARVLRPGGALLLRGARRDDEELGLVGFNRRELERLFGTRGFAVGELEPIVMTARSGGLEAYSTILRNSL